MPFKNRSALNDIDNIDIKKYMENILTIKRKIINCQNILKLGNNKKTENDVIKDKLNYEIIYHKLCTLELKNIKWEYSNIIDEELDKEILEERIERHLLSINLNKLIRLYNGYQYYYNCDLEECECHSLKFTYLKMKNSVVGEI